MKVTGIIAEYNPFHKGHEYHIKRAKEITGADYCIVIMSGDFVQRGVPALTDKYLRTQMALLGGADLVLELPAPYACASAEIFAEGAIRILDGLNIVDFLCFGSETGENAPLSKESPIWKVASVLVEEPKPYKEALQRYLKAGLSFPKARYQALLSAIPALSGYTGLESLLNHPNDILAIEYCKAIKNLSSNITPTAIRRQGGHYHDATLSDSYSSASAIREALKTTEIAMLKDELPAGSYQLLKENWKRSCPIVPDDFSLMLHYALLQHARQAGNYTVFTDITEDLSDKIVKNLSSYRDFSSFCEILKSKDMTASRISRSLLHILLNQTKEQMLAFRSPDFTGYARILGFRKSSSELLSQLKKQAGIPLISKPADAKRILGEGDAFTLFCAETYAADIYNAVVSNKFGVPTKHEYTHSVIRISSCPFMQV